MRTTETIIARLCYLCGESGASRPLALKDSFTAHSMARCPDSHLLCERCDWAINLQCWYWNANKQHEKTGQIGMWSQMTSRNWSWLLSERQSYPNFGGPESHWPQEPNPGKEKQASLLPVVMHLPTRAMIREWLIEPPAPPFEIVIAESGQKHILPWAQKARDKERFPVMFELDQIYIERTEFAGLLSVFESLMVKGFSKTEILSGEYRSDRLMRCGLLECERLDIELRPYRGTRLLELVNHIAIMQIAAAGEA